MPNKRHCKSIQPDSMVRRLQWNPKTNKSLCLNSSIDLHNAISEEDDEWFKTMHKIRKTNSHSHKFYYESFLFKNKTSSPLGERDLSQSKRRSNEFLSFTHQVDTVKIIRSKSLNVLPESHFNNYFQGLL